MLEVGTWSSHIGKISSFGNLEMNKFLRLPNPWMLSSLSPFLFPKSRLSLSIIMRFSNASRCFRKDDRHGHFTIINVLSAVKLCIPSIRDSKWHPIMHKIRRELNHLLPTSHSLWGKTFYCVVTNKCLKFIIFPISLGNSSSDTHWPRCNICNWCSFQIEFGSLLML